MTQVHHGTQTTYTGYPTEQTDIYGLTGIFFTEDADDAETFAEGSTQGSMDEDLRIFTAEVDLSDAYDLATESDEENLEHDEIVERALGSNANVIILPDMSGVSEREILVTRTSIINWQ